MVETTNLEDLPISPQTEDGNIQLKTTERNVKIDSTINNLREQREADIASIGVSGAGPGGGAGPAAGSGPTGLGENVNHFVSSVQEAVASGALGLESRDVPQSQTHITQDAQMQPNFVPNTEHVDYIRESNRTEDVVRENAIKQKSQDNVDAIYNNLQTPLLLAVLYFIFQLPVVKQTTLRLLPSLFHKDGNPNLSGYLINSIAFAGLYCGLMATLHYFSL